MAIQTMVKKGVSTMNNTPFEIPHLENLTNALARLDNDTAAPYRRMLADLPAKPHGTMRQWMRSRHGRKVETLQVKPNGRPWLPGPRIVDASRATYVRLGDNGSRREYRGAHVMGSDDTTLVVRVNDGFDHVVIYRDA